mmetsp:Transcript_19201/g.38936  ORF Transcript_19201/g.38936 Transcript_19201/m.38936 type:complete len:229 (-) Transcript_19201:645-1331(-)|eukprot:CAMPEP_0183307268 /NCGR_PEP_ID=MMETSP0160_2-20130417/17231_1 /TAXON_ID=2839 ORGANISM="Odontella Sinensis, Strain Grunow 1884" /NCGR_SAMPLE_ID=MMETSP0160_2 /ASSEMBLY_ACC=CAM_ASM_000250 /LENGTH=228 /DNA_ID=CAMNT_0025470821 /DNA_START=11 /DNA_END=697 /DNA_ORIENTATION=+
MTIKVERDAFLLVLNGESSPASQEPQAKPPSNTYDDDAEIVIYSPKDQAPVLIPRSPSGFHFWQDCNDLFTPELVDSDVDSEIDDDCSFDVPLRSRRRVTFAQPLITDVWTRPRTLSEDLGSLFYTYEETQRFRQEYRLERKLIAQLEEDSTATQSNKDEAFLLCNGRSPRHRISRVVVRHQDTFETFYDDNLALHKESPSLVTPSVMSKSDDFFDNDSFWSGSITWY